MARKSKRPDRSLMSVVEKHPDIVKFGDDVFSADFEDAIYRVAEDEMDRHPVLLDRNRGIVIEAVVKQMRVGKKKTKSAEQQTAPTEQQSKAASKRHLTLGLKHLAQARTGDSNPAVALFKTEVDKVKNPKMTYNEAAIDGVCKTYKQVLLESTRIEDQRTQ